MGRKNKREKRHIGEIRFIASGAAFFNNEQYKDLYIHPSETWDALHLDTVEIVKNEDYESYSVFQIIKRNKTKFVGIIGKEGNNYFLKPNSQYIPQIFDIDEHLLNNAKIGDAVIIELLNYHPHNNPEGKVIEILGNPKDNSTVMHAILHEYGLPYRFPQEVLNEAALISTEISEEEISKRLDYRNILTFTIDGSDSKDFDDALSIEWIDGKLRVGVHIADVTHYVKPNSLVYEEAYNRGTSVYLVDRCVPMLPEKLSNDLCSLNPHTDKLVYSFLFTLDGNGRIIDEQFCRGIINSNYRLTYDEVQDIIEGTYDKDNEMHQAVKVLDNYAKKINKLRIKNESLHLRGSEVKFVLDDNAKPTGIKITQQKDSNKLIEEFMILTNRRVCEFITKKGVNTVHRTHDYPDPVKLESLQRYVIQLGYELNVGNENMVKKSLNALVAEVEGKPEENIINNLVVRTMSKANYQTTNIGHYGLGLDYYSHVTSPIRRMADVFTHEILSTVLPNNGYIIDVEIPKQEDGNDLDEMCKHISEREKLAQKAERESIKYKQAEFLSESIGKKYDGIISGVQEYGLFVEIPSCGCEGLLKLTDMKGSYTADVKNYRVVGPKKYRLGDNIQVFVKSVDIQKKEINLAEYAL